MQRNIKLMKIIMALNQAWFWFGIWIFYYLKFIDYGGIGIIESLMITSVFLLEIPTGALADLLGKKRTILIAIITLTIGQIVMTIAQDSLYIFISVFILSIGKALLSGTSDAIIFDSLKEIKQEKFFELILSQVRKYGLIVLAISSILGGFLYTINPRLPFLMTTLAFIISIPLGSLLQEPVIDTIKLNFRNYIKQNIKGFGQLFSNRNPKIWLFRLLALSGFIVIYYEFLDQALGMSFGFNEKWMGIIFAIVPIVNAFGNHVYPITAKILKKSSSWLMITICILVSALISPYLGMLFGGLTILFRNFFYPFIDITTSNTINQTVDSKYRATTLSTFNMLKSIPYIFLAFFIGKAVDNYSAMKVSMWISIIFILITLIIYLISVINIIIKKNKIKLSNKV